MRCGDHPSGGLMFAIFPLLLAMAATPPPPSAVLESPTRHIRTTNAYVSSLLKDGFYRSPTFARLVTRLERSDLIVYIELLERMPSGIEGRMMMMPRTHDHRYVRIQIEMQGSNADGVALLGHELQHARELADAPS